MSSNKIRPLYDQILVKRADAVTQQQTVSGIYMPEIAVERELRGEVLAVGDGQLLPDGTLRVLTVKPGDVVLFDRRGWVEVKVDGEEYLVMRESAVLAIVNITRA